jgi:hypothetical protein
MSLRKLIGRVTSPFFVPLRKFVVWGDEQFGTCDHKLSVVPREYESKVVEEVVVEKQASELEKKLSKDKANLQGLGNPKSNCDDDMVGC